MVAFINLVFSVVSLVFLMAQGVIASPVVPALVPRAITPATNTTKNTTSIPTSIIPQSCSSQCANNTLNSLTNCTTSGCQCTQDVYDDVQSCLVCVVQNNGLSNSTGQNLLAEYTKTCSTLGVELEDAVSGAARLKIASLGAFATMVVAVLLSVV